MIESLEKLRKHAEACTMEGGKDEFDTVWMTKSAFLDYLDAIEREVDGGYVELPKDADGEYIHIGDRVEDNERVARILLTDGSWEPSVYVEKAPCLLEEYFCNEVSHYHDPTVEDLLFEFAQFWSDEELTDIEHLQPHAAQTIAKLAAKLQLKEAE